MENPMLDFDDYISRAYKDGFNDGVASMAKPFGNGMDVCPVCGSPSTIGKPVTNADRIRAMSIEKLAGYLFWRGNGGEYCYGICAYQDECKEYHSDEFCIEQIAKWLREEAKT